jgi:hypothetical protein
MVYIPSNTTKYCILVFTYATCFGLFLGHHLASAYNYTTVHNFSTIFYVYMLIVCTHYTLYCLYSTHECVQTINI